jgi:hypothetical protein
MKSSRKEDSCRDRKRSIILDYYQSYTLQSRSNYTSVFADSGCRSFKLGAFDQRLNGHERISSSNRYNRLSSRSRLTIVVVSMERVRQANLIYKQTAEYSYEGIGSGSPGGCNEGKITRNLGELMVGLECPPTTGGSREER